jgi:hypothetical protein
MEHVPKKQKQRIDSLNTASVIYKEEREKLHGRKDEKQSPYQKKRRKGK